MADYIIRMFPANDNREHIIPAGTSIAGITEGFVELYRVTGDKKYLDFAKNLQYEPHWYYLVVPEKVGFSWRVLLVRALGTDGVCK